MTKLRVLGVVENMCGMLTPLPQLQLRDVQAGRPAPRPAPSRPPRAAPVHPPPRRPPPRPQGRDVTEQSLRLLGERCPELLSLFAYSDVFPSAGGGAEAMAASFGVPFLGRVSNGHPPPPRHPVSPPRFPPGPHASGASRPGDRQSVRGGQVVHCRRAAAWGAQPATAHRGQAHRSDCWKPGKCHGQWQHRRVIPFPRVLIGEDGRCPEVRGPCAGDRVCGEIVSLERLENL